LPRPGRRKTPSEQQRIAPDQRRGVEIEEFPVGVAQVVDEPGEFAAAFAGSGCTAFLNASSIQSGMSRLSSSADR
jgi:hypothetical protein